MHGSRTAGSTVVLSTELMWFSWGTVLTLSIEVFLQAGCTLSGIDYIGKSLVGQGLHGIDPTRYGPLPESGQYGIIKYNSHITTHMYMSVGRKYSDWCLYFLILYAGVTLKAAGMQGHMG